MICPRCSVAEIVPETNQCQLCGYTLLGARSVSVEGPVADEVLETVQGELRDRFELQVLVRRERGSTLYLARDVEDDRLVSLRLIPRQGPVEGPLIHRFAQAATLAAQFRHPHIVALRKHGVTHSLLWYSTDVVKSRTLSMMLQAAEPMSLAQTLQLLEQVASGLEYLHRNAVVHAGIGRETILVDAEGWVRVSDPGTAAAVYRAAGPGHGWERLLDLPFAPPELLERRLMGPAADQYSLAAVAYACLAGRPPFEADSVDGIRRERAGVIPPLREQLPDLDPYVETAILRAMRDEPTERFGSVLDLVAVLGGSSVRPSTAMLVPSARPRGEAMTVVSEARGAARQGLTSVAGIQGAIAGALGGPRRRWVVTGGVVIALAVAGAWGLSQLQTGGGSAAGWADGPAAAAVPNPALVVPRAPVQGATSETAAPRDVRDILESAAAGPEIAAPTPRRAAPAGALFINASPWGSLYVDGTLVGNTPQVNLQLPTGQHTLRIVRDGFVPWEQEVQVTAGDTLRLTNIVLQPLQL